MPLLHAFEPPIDGILIVILLNTVLSFLILFRTIWFYMYIYLCQVGVS
jgi:hypothetical protein